MSLLCSKFRCVYLVPYFLAGYEAARCHRVRAGDFAESGKGSMVAVKCVEGLEVGYGTAQ